MSLREYLTVDTTAFEAGMRRAETSGEKLAQSLNTTLSDANRRQIAEIQALENQIRDTEREKNKLFDPKAVEEANSAIQDLTREKRKLEESIRGPRKETEGLGGWFQKLGGMAKAWIAGVAIAAFAALGGMIRKAVSEAAEFEEEFNRVKTQIGDASANTKAMEKDLRHMAATGRTPLKDLTRGLHDVIGAGIDAGQSVKVLDAANRAATAGGTDVITVVDGMTSAMNAYGMGADQATAITDAMFVAVRNGKMEFGELASSMGTVAPIASTVGVELNQVMAAVSALTQTGQSTPESATGVRSLLMSIIKPSQQASELAKQLGIDFSAAALKGKGLPVFLNEVKTATAAAGMEMSVLFEDVRAFSTATALTGPVASGFAKTLEEIGNSAGTTAENLNKVTTGVTSQWDVFKNRINETFLELGQKLLPLVNTGLERMLELFKAGTDPGRSLVDIMRGLGVGEDEIRRVETMNKLLDARAERDRLLQSVNATTIGTELRLQRQQQYSGVGGNPQRTGQAVDVLRAFNEFNVGEMLNAEGADKTIARIDDELEKLRQTALDIGKAFESGTLPIDSYNQFNAQIRSNQKAFVEAREAIAQYAEATDLASLSVDELIAREDAFNEAEKQKKAAKDAAAAAEVLQRERAEAWRKFDASSKAASDEATRRVANQIRFRQELERAVNSSAIEIETVWAIDHTQARAAIANERQLLEERIDSYRAHAQELGKTAKEIDEGVAALEAEFSQKVDQILAQVTVKDPFKNINDALARFNERLTELRLDFERGLITDEIFDQRSTVLAEEFRQQLEAIYSELESMGLLTAEVKQVLTGAFSQASKAASDTKKSTTSLSDTLTDMAEAANSVLNLADAFGDLDDNVRRVAQGSIDAIRNLARLNKLREAKAAGEKITGVAMAVPMLGVAAGIATIISGIISLKSETDQAVAEYAEKMIQLTRALEENRYAYQKAASDFLRASVVGSDIRASQLERIQKLFDTLNSSISKTDSGRRASGYGSNGGPVIETSLTMKEVEALLLELERTGIPQFQGLMDRLNLLLQQNGNSLGRALSDLLAGIDGGIEDIIKNFGTFGDSLDGVIKKFELSRVIGISDQDAFQALVADLLKLGEASGEARSLLEQLVGVDITTEAGREQVRLIAQALGQAFIDNRDLFGDFTPAELEQLINRLLGISGGSGSGASAEGFTRSQQVARTITDIQANEVIALLSNIELWTRLTYEHQSGDMAVLRGPVPTAGQALLQAVVDAVVNGNVEQGHALASISTMLSQQIHLQQLQLQQLLELADPAWRTHDLLMAGFKAWLGDLTRPGTGVVPEKPPPSITERNEYNISLGDINGQLTDSAIDGIMDAIGRELRRQSRRPF